MSNTKTTSVLNIIGNATKLYLQNFFSLTIPVILPVLVMFLAIGLIFLPVYFLPEFYFKLIGFMPFFKELIPSLILIICLILPGLIIFKFAFWNYMLKMVSLNCIVGDILRKKLLKPSKYYTQIVALRSKDYLLMLLIWCSIILMGLALPVSLFLFNIEPAIMPYLLIGFEFIMIFLLIILSVYLSLSFQVFAFETSFTPMQVLEGSFKLVLNNFWRLVILCIVFTFISVVLIPQIFLFTIDIFLLKASLALPFKAVLEQFFNNYPDIYNIIQLAPVFSYESMDKFILEYSKILSTSTLSSIISLMLLPLGACYYTLFYFDARKRYAGKTEALQQQQAEIKTKRKRTIKKNV